MVKENYFKLLNYLWDLKEIDSNIVINLRLLQKDAREPIDIFLGDMSRFYLDVVEDGFIVVYNDMDPEEVNYEELVDMIAEDLEVFLEKK